jgi:hypothetical protein
MHRLAERCSRCQFALLALAWEAYTDPPTTSLAAEALVSRVEALREVISSISTTVEQEGRCQPESRGLGGALQLIAGTLKDLGTGAKELEAGVRGRGVTQAVVDSASERLRETLRVQQRINADYVQPLVGRGEVMLKALERAAEVVKEMGQNEKADDS